LTEAVDDDALWLIPTVEDFEWYCHVTELAIDAISSDNGLIESLTPTVRVEIASRCAAQAVNEFPAAAIFRAQSVAQEIERIIKAGVCWF